MAQQVKVTDEMKEQILEMTRKGMAPAAIAAELEVSAPTIYRTLQELGVRPARAQISPVTKKLNDAEVDDLVALYYDFVPITEILRKFDIGHNQLYMLLKELSLEPRAKLQETVAARSAAMDHAIDLYVNYRSMTVKEILAETGVTQPELNEAVRARNLPMRRPRKSQDSRDNPLPRRYEQ